MGILHNDGMSQHETLRQLFNSVDYSKLNTLQHTGLGDDPGDEGTIIDPNDTPTPLHPKLQHMVNAMITAVPSLKQEHALYFLLHTPRGRRLAEHLSSIT